ncbi:MAG TPA: hypothetical protein VLA04_00710 [Verrucomicrobiae bacterium]|nr:hypothetical protein [Verrucomicrobiae bacterium]
MQTIANFWPLWLVITLLAGAIMFTNQLGRMKGMTVKGNTDPAKSFFAGMSTLVIAWLVGSVSSVLLVIGIIVKVIEYAKQ